MTQLHTTHRTTVTEDQIDHLGHMNVRYYGVAAQAASSAFVDDIGLGAAAVDPADVYTRHFREQLLGAELEVRTGVLGLGEGWLRLYHELRNRDTDELSASFVHRMVARGTRPATWPAAADLEIIDDIPEAGRPRSIRLDTDPLAAAPDLATARERPELAMRLPRSVEAEECDPDGGYLPSGAPMLLWAGEALEGATSPTLHPGPDGQLIGWATMEHRLLTRRLPRVGDRIQSFGATVEIHDKTTRRVMWAYDLDEGDLLVAFEVVDVALDTVSRRAVSIPDDLRAHSQARYRPDLAPPAP